MRQASINNTKNTGNRGNRQNRPLFEEVRDSIFEHEEDAQYMRRRQRREERTERKDSNINFIKMKIPQFKRQNDAKTYLEWERKVKLIFECHNYSKEKKIKLHAVKFTNYVLV